MVTYENVKNGYDNLWKRCELKPERRAQALTVAKKLIANKARYERIAASVGCPWWWIAVTHQMESNANFTTYLGNGDPLNKRTTHVPAGRGPFATFEAGAIDALRLKGLQAIKDWPVSRCLFEFEAFNGWGYIAKKINSPYLWSFTNLYSRGKYVADGKYDASAVSSQCGGAAILKAFIEIEAVSFEKEDSMSELIDTLRPFEQIVPSLVRAIAGTVPSIAVRALSEALETPVDSVLIRQKLEELKIKDMVAALQQAEATINTVMPEVPTPPVRATVDAAPAEVAALVDTGPMTIQPVKPEPSRIDTLTGGWLTGWKTNMGIAVYVAAHVAGSLGYLDASNADAISVMGAGLAGIGAISKVERWLPLFAGFLRVKKMLA